MLGSATWRARIFYCLDDVHALNDLAEHNVLAVEPRGNHSGDEELYGERLSGAKLGTGDKVHTWEPLVLGPAFAMERRPGLV